MQQQTQHTHDRAREQREHIRRILRGQVESAREVREGQERVRVQLGESREAEAKNRHRSIGRKQRHSMPRSDRSDIRRDAYKRRRSRCLHSEQLQRQHD